jgi:hypothetical protein
MIKMVTTLFGGKSHDDNEFLMSKEMAFLMCGNIPKKLILVHR